IEEGADRGARGTVRERSALVVDEIGARPPVGDHAGARAKVEHIGRAAARDLCDVQIERREAAGFGKGWVAINDGGVARALIFNIDATVGAETPEIGLVLAPSIVDVMLAPFGDRGGRLDAREIIDE